MTEHGLLCKHVVLAGSASMYTGNTRGWYYSLLVLPKFSRLDVFKALKQYPRSFCAQLQLFQGHMHIMETWWDIGEG